MSLEVDFLGSEPLEPAVKVHSTGEDYILKNFTLCTHRLILSR